MTHFLRVLIVRLPHPHVSAPTDDLDSGYDGRSPRDSLWSDPGSIAETPSIFDEIKNFSKGTLRPVQKRAVGSVSRARPQSLTHSLKEAFSTRFASVTGKFQCSGELSAWFLQHHTGDTPSHTLTTSRKH